MSSKEIDQTVTTTNLLQKVLPVKGEIIHGISMQGDARDVVNITKVDLKNELNARVKERTKLRAAAQAAFSKAVNVRDEAARIIEVPRDLYTDLEPVAKALLKFHAGAYVVKKDEDKGKNYVKSVDFHNKTMHAVAVVADPEKGTLYTGNRTYPLPTSVVALNDVVVKLEAEVAGYNGDLLQLRESLAGLDDVVEALQAAVLRQGLEGSESGKAALKTMGSVMSSVLEKLDKSMSTATASS